MMFKIKIATLWLLIGAIVGCKMPTNEQADPLQPGTYLAQNGAVTSRLVIDDRTVTWTNNIASTSTANSNFVVFTYTKHKTVALDFDHIYTRTPDGVKLVGGNVTKRYYGLQLKATPLGAGAFYRLENPLVGATANNRNYMIVANFSSKGIIDSLVVRPSGILMANSYIESDRYFPPEYNIVGTTPVDKPASTNTPARPQNIDLYLDGQKSDFTYKTSLTGSEQKSPLQGLNWVRQRD